MMERNYVMKELDREKQKFIVKIIFLAGIMLLLILNFSSAASAVMQVYDVLYPLLLGLGIAYIINILVSGYEVIYFPRSNNKLLLRNRRSIAIILAMLTIVLILMMFLHIVVPQVGQSIALLSSGVPDMYNKAVEWSQQSVNDIPEIKAKIRQLGINQESMINQSLSWLRNWAGGTVSFIGSIFGTIFNLVFAIIFAIYILFYKDDLKRIINKLARAFLSFEHREKLIESVKIMDDTFRCYIVGQCKEAVLFGILCTLGMLIFQFPYATVIGSVMGLTALVPILGAYIGAIVGFLLIAAVDPIRAILFIVFIIILQQIEGNLIYPRVVGKSIGLPEIWLFAAVTIGGGLMGITGIFLGVPAAATIYKLISKNVNDRLKAVESTAKASVLK